MPRLPRIQLDGAFYLVTSRGSSTGPLFQDAQDYQTYLALLADHKRRHQFELFAYCLLAEQLFLCIEVTPPATISAIMHDVTAAYTRYFNKRYGREGHLFQERFKATVVEKAAYLLPLTAYVHRYPERAGLATEAAAYPFSSYAQYCRGNASPMQFPMAAEMQDVFTQLSTEPTAAAYEQYVRQWPAADAAQLAKALEQRIVGSEAFVQSVNDRLIRLKQEAQPRTLQPLPESAERPARPALLHRVHVPLAVGSAVAVMGMGLLTLALSQRIGFMEQGLLALLRGGERSLIASPHSQQVLPASASSEVTSAVAHLDGTVWELRVMPIQTSSASAMQSDELTFTRTQVSSKALASSGFPGSRYTLTTKPDGSAVWETMQLGPNGNLVSWRGQWQGDVMRGTLTKQVVGQAPEQLTFVGVVQKSDKTMRSEI